MSSDGRNAIVTPSAATDKFDHAKNSKSGRDAHSAADRAQHRAFRHYESKYPSRAKSKRLQHRMFLDPILNRHHRGCRNQRQHQADARVAEPVNEANQFRQVGQRIGLKHAFGARGRGHRAGVKLGINLDGNGIRVGAIAEMDLHLRDSPNILLAACPLQKLKLRVDQASSAALAD